MSEMTFDHEDVEEIEYGRIVLIVAGYLKDHGFRQPGDVFVAMNQLSDDVFEIMDLGKSERSSMDGSIFIQ